MTELHSKYPVFLEDHSDYVDLNDDIDPAVEDACTLLDDPKCKRLAHGVISVFRGNFIKDMIIACEDLDELQKEYLEMRSSSTAAKFRNQLAELAQYGITCLRELHVVVSKRTTLDRAEKVWLALVYKIARDNSQQEGWTLTKTFPIELLVAAYDVLS